MVVGGGKTKEELIRKYFPYVFRQALLDINVYIESIIAPVVKKPREITTDEDDLVSRIFDDALEFLDNNNDCNHDKRGKAISSLENLAHAYEQFAPQELSGVRIRPEGYSSPEVHQAFSDMGFRNPTRFRELMINYCRFLRQASNILLDESKEYRRLLTYVPEKFKTPRDIIKIGRGLL